MDKHLKEANNPTGSVLSKMVTMPSKSRFENEQRPLKEGKAIKKSIWHMKNDSIVQSNHCRMISSCHCVFITIVLPQCDGQQVIKHKIYLLSIKHLNEQLTIKNWQFPGSRQ